MFVLLLYCYCPVIHNLTTDHADIFQFIDHPIYGCNSNPTVYLRGKIVDLLAAGALIIKYNIQKFQSLLCDTASFFPEPCNDQFFLLINIETSYFFFVWFIDVVCSDEQLPAHPLHPAHPPLHFPFFLSRITLLAAKYTITNKTANTTIVPMTIPPLTGRRII